MNVRDTTAYSLRAVVTHPLRAFLTVGAIAVGVAAVVLLTALGEGVRGYVTKEFSQFGTNIIAINPGRLQTHGVPLGVFGTVRPLTIEDALALERLPAVESSVPVVQGNADVEYGRRTRRTTILGVNHAMLRAFTMDLANGEFLPDGDPFQPRPLVVLGATVAKELFPDRSPLGEAVRVGGNRFIVIGVMASKGTILGFDMDDIVYIPAARALSLFNREGLMEIDIVFSANRAVESVVKQVTTLLEARHGAEDFTITTQQQMLSVLDSVMNALTAAVAGLGGISLLVAAVGILTMMTIALAERQKEFGLLFALGIHRRQLLVLVVLESLLLAGSGGVIGILIGIGGAVLVSHLIEGFPVSLEWRYIAAAEMVALFIGAVAGVLPAIRASLLDPIETLRTE